MADELTVPVPPVGASAKLACTFGYTVRSTVGAFRADDPYVPFLVVVVLADSADVDAGVSGFNDPDGPKTTR